MNRLRELNRAFAALSVSAAAVCAGNAAAQSFNVDVNTALAGAPGIGAPSDAFGAAAGQPGRWNAISGNTVLSIPLLKLDGSPSAVTFARQVATGGNFAFNNANSSGDYELLMDDGYDFSQPPNGFLWFRFTGLQNGTYEVYSYAIAPDFAFDYTECQIGGDPFTIEVCGGAMPVNAFVLGVTHITQTVVVTDGTLEMQYDGQFSTDSLGTLNGLQIKLLPRGGVCRRHQRRPRRERQRSAGGDFNVGSVPRPVSAALRCGHRAGRPAAGQLLGRCE